MKKSIMAVALLTGILLFSSLPAHARSHFSYRFYAGYNNYGYQAYPPYGYQPYPPPPVVCDSWGYCQPVYGPPPIYYAPPPPRYYPRPGFGIGIGIGRGNYYRHYPHGGYRRW